VSNRKAHRRHFGIIVRAERFVQQRYRRLLRSEGHDRQLKQRRERRVARAFMRAAEHVRDWIDEARWGNGEIA
jgi:hypothetical protein